MLKRRSERKKGIQTNDKVNIPVVSKQTVCFHGPFLILIGWIASVHLSVVLLARQLRPQIVTEKE